MNTSGKGPDPQRPSPAAQDINWNEVEIQEFANEKMVEGYREAPGAAPPMRTLNPTQLAQLATEVGCKVWVMGTSFFWRF